MRQRTSIGDVDPGSAGVTRVQRITRSVSGSPLATPWRKRPDAVPSDDWAYKISGQMTSLRSDAARSDPTDAAVLQRN
jgi:hypothetical protein